MNIFITDPCPIKSAQALCDLRLNKMILETAQMLCTAYRYFVVDDPEILYKPTHTNHPCTIWARKVPENYLWLYQHFKALSMEKFYRTGKHHLTSIKLDEILKAPIHAFGLSTSKKVYPDITFNCSDVYPSTGNVHLDYKICLYKKWIADKRQPKFTKRTFPSWMTDPYILVKRKTYIDDPDYAKSIRMRELVYNALNNGYII